MKTKEEIEQLAKDFIEERGLKVFNKEIETAPLDEKATHFLQLGIKLGFRTAYTQCQEDIKKEINSLKKTMIESSHQAMTWEEKYWQLKNSLNKQD